MQTLTIGELAQVCEINLETLRYYERVGLMQPPPRSSSGHRQYPASAAERLVFIRRAQSLGFTLTEIRELLHLKREPGELCADVVKSIDTKLVEVEKKIADLRSIRIALGKMKELCHGDCLIGDCPILENLEHSSKPSGTKRSLRKQGRTS
ncbi:MerR family DNA-binding protein [Granulicella sp. dw_53]|uniref:MerR family DNA-binding protein n=1 Tax=Granulicella sp. dw_53 TaxID=2719792 RepID=UPI001BD2FDAF|nr:MerR family DNA-binding protein [Granulicella sp. dw_53]